MNKIIPVKDLIEKMRLELAEEKEFEKKQRIKEKLLKKKEARK
jgi:hypothetical protein